MKIIVAGDGKVGSMVAGQLSGEGHELTLIDKDPAALQPTIEHYDVMSLAGNCASMEVLRNAGVEEADLLIAATGVDEVNLLCCLTAHGMNPNLHTIARIRRPEYSETLYALRKQFALSLVVNPERQTAKEINRLLRYPAFLKREEFANGTVELIELRIDEESPICNQPLSKLSKILRCRMLVCCVVRDGQSFTPSGSFVLRSGDRIYATATAATITQLLKSLHIQTPRMRSVTICGGGSICDYLADLLIKEGVYVKIIEKDRERCEALADRHPEAFVVCGDLSSQDVLERERVVDCDAFVTATGNDELDVLLSIYANSCKVPQVITKLGRAENLSLISQLPVGRIVSPKELCSRTIARYVRAMSNGVDVASAVTIHFIAGGQAEAIEFVVDTATRYCGVPLKDIPLKKNVLIASISHDRTSEIPAGNSMYHVGDHLVIVTASDKVVQQLNDIFER
jgi:trk system potassium uptake protein TrkA